MATIEERRIQALESQVEQLTAQVEAQRAMIQHIIVCYVPVSDLAELKADCEHRSMRRQ